MKKLVTSLALVAVIVSTPVVAFAHVVVKPAEVATASFQTFNTGVPNEKDIAVTGVRVVIPAGMDYVTPTVKPGWAIETKKEGDKITEISWTGGTVPAGQRDDFTFGAQAPAKATTLQWKAYQTYEDGTVVAWDQKPSKEEKESDTAGPYSETKVVNDLAAAKTTTDSNKKEDTASSTLGVALGTLGVLLGGAALLTKRK